MQNTVKFTRIIPKYVGTKFTLYTGLRRINMTDLGSVLGASYVIADYYIFAIFVAVAFNERSGSLRNL